MRIDGLEAQERARAVDMALHHVAPERSPRRCRQLQIYGRSRRKQGKGSARHRLRRQIRMKAAGLDIQRGQANAADRDAVAGAQRNAMSDWQGDGNPPRTLALFDGKDGARGFYQPSKHVSFN